MPAGGLVTAGAIGLGETVVGLINKGKAKNEANRLAASRPQYAESPYYKQGLSLAESELSTGMSGEAKQAYEEGIDRNLSASLGAILKSGGNPNNVAAVFDVANQGRQKLAMMKDNLRLNQINNLVRSQQLASDEREKAFQFNQWAPWADAAKANAAARTEAAGEISTGINTLGSSIMQGANLAKGAKELGSFFEQPAGQPGPSLSGNQGLANVGAQGPNTSNIAPAFINPNQAQPLDTGLDMGGIPDIATLE